MAAVTYVTSNKSLLFVPEHFDAREANAFVSWKAGIKRGARIRRGTVLATIIWSDGLKESILSPVAGTIVSTNRRIDHEMLHERPGQLALLFA
jgi:hypothetical protein